MELKEVHMVGTNEQASDVRAKDHVALQIFPLLPSRNSVRAHLHDSANLPEFLDVLSPEQAGRCS